jgi:hypothetical protein
VLTVTLAEGIAGTPATGTYTYEENGTVDYNYSLQSGYTNLVVTLDGNAVAESGSFTMDRDHSLNVTADAMVDISGTWVGELTCEGYSFYFKADFSGGYYTGVVSNVENGGVVGKGNGTYTISGDQIEFHLEFYYNAYDYTGTIDNPNHMSGEWTEPGGVDYGTWYLDRQ